MSVPSIQDVSFTEKGFSGQQSSVVNNGITLCRDLHKIPELGFEELKTSQYVRYSDGILGVALGD